MTHLDNLIDKWSFEKIQECVEQIPWDHEMVYHTTFNILEDADKTADFDIHDLSMKIANHARSLWNKPN